VWIVVDDYENVAGDHASENLLAQLLLGGRTHTLVTSRIKPAWLTARRLTYGEIVMVDARELAMTPDESAVVFEAMGRTAEPELAALTNGWPAAISLAALGGLDASAVTGALEDFLASEVCRSLDAEEREILSILSAFSTIDSSVAAAIFGRERSSSTLKRAQTLGVLEKVRDEHFELHPLVRDFLQKLPLDDSSIRLVEESGEALAAMLAWSEMFELADRLASERLLDLLLLRGVRPALHEGRAGSVRRWIDYARLRRMSELLVRLGEAELALRDGYYLQSETLSAEVALSLSERADARTWALGIAGRAAHLGGREEQAVNYYRAARACARSGIDQRDAEWGELKAAIDLELSEAPGLLQGLRESGSVAAADQVEVASRSLMLGARRGSLESLEEARTVLQIVDLLPDAVARTSFRNTYAYACAIAGDYEDALATLAKLEEDAQRQRLLFALPYVCCARAVVYAAQRAFDDALAELTSASLEARRVSDHHVLAMCAAIRGRIFIARGQFLEARTACAYTHPSLIKSMHGELIVTQALAFACAGNDDDALATSRRAAEVTTAVEVQGIARCVEAIVQSNRGDKRAEAAAEAAVAYARSARYVDGLIAAYRGTPELARLVVRSREHRAWFMDVMQRARDDEIARIAGLGMRADANYLSKREAEVFSLMRLGLTNRDIGSRLFITEDTAKLHVYRIMKKLGARSRTEAAMRVPKVERSG
jgi:ATP/maltotriose-dependent transcriptional regulator MalT